MRQRIGDVGSLLAVAASMAWLAACALMTASDPSPAIFLAIVGATLTACMTMLLLKRRTQIIFEHGYHAGYHAGSTADCPYPARCDVLVLAEERAKRA